MSKETAIHISKDERERAVARSRRMYETDMMSNLATAEDRGYAEVFRQTRVESIRAVMKNIGLSLEQAMRAFDIPQEEFPTYQELLKTPTPAQS